MPEALTVVLDVGKTLSKVSLWNVAGELVAREILSNVSVQGADYRALDAARIENWVAGVLSDFSIRGLITAIIPIAHGAAAAVVRHGALAYAVMDYESAIPAIVRQAYAQSRDPFAATGSPLLPVGLNIGAQLHWLEQLHPDLLSNGAMILPWPQYWAWVLCGVPASEMTTLGCHSDLWNPASAQPSHLSSMRGWAQKMAPLRRAGEVLGKISARWATRTGLSPEVDVYCGLHDSNAALVAARGFRDLETGDMTVLSTGTWFVAMRSMATDARLNIAALPEARDCLVNVDAYGALTPSARFMGGREAEVLCGENGPRIDSEFDQPAFVDAARRVVASAARACPSFVSQVGPFAQNRGRWVHEPQDPIARGAAVSLYLALVADTSLNLIGSRDRLLIEGRFAQSEVFVRALAALRPDDQVFVCKTPDQADVSFGALRVIDPTRRPNAALQKVAPMDIELGAYAAQWRRDAATLEGAI